jgi:hypothetical protein
MNRKVHEQDGYIIHKYGCCGQFFFLVAIDATKYVTIRTLPDLDSAIEWIKNNPLTL